MTTERLSSDTSTINDDITTLKKRVKKLRADIKIHCSTIASAYAADEFPTDLVDAINQQQAHAQESLWRIGAGVTAFKVQDPDPHAVNGGSVLGIRFEVMRGGRFPQPYVVLLNRPYGTEGGSEAGDHVAKTYLRVHRHTIPNLIPLGGLAARYLPPPTLVEPVGDEDVLAKRRIQNVSLFVKELRQRLVAYHNRLGAVADMRRAAGIVPNPDEEKRKTRRTENEADAAPHSSKDDENQTEGGDDTRSPRIIDIGPADAEAKQITIDWSNGDICRLVIDDGGEVEKCVMYGRHGRDMPAARMFLQSIFRVDRLPESIRRKRGLEPA